MNSIGHQINQSVVPLLNDTQTPGANAGVLSASTSQADVAASGATNSHTPAQSVEMADADVSAKFAYDPDVNQVIITLRSQDSGAVIQQVPPESIVKMLTRLMESQGKTLDVTG